MDSECVVVDEWDLEVDGECRARTWTRSLGLRDEVE